MNVSIDLSTLDRIDETSDYGSMVDSSDNYEAAFDSDCDSLDISVKSDLNGSQIKASVKCVVLPANLRKESINDQIGQIKIIYENTMSRLIKAKTKIVSHVQQVQALNRVILQMDYHISKLSKLPKLINLYANLQSHKVQLRPLQHNPSNDHVQFLIDLFYYPYNTFFLIYNNCSSTFDFLNNFAKLEKNLERLNEIVPTFEKLKEEMYAEYDYRKLVISELRVVIVKDLISVINELASEKENDTSIAEKYTQISNIKSFKRLLNTIK